jgi:hypothetical protein
MYIVLLLMSHVCGQSGTGERASADTRNAGAMGPGMLRLANEQMEANEERV